MNLNRRQFLKIMLAGAGAAVAPALLLGKTKELDPYVEFKCGPQKAGDYCFSFYYKKAKDIEYRRYVETITLEEDMELIAKATLLDGDVLRMPQIELIPSAPIPKGIARSVINVTLTMPMEFTTVDKASTIDKGISLHDVGYSLSMGAGYPELVGLRRGKANA